MVDQGLYFYLVLDRKQREHNAMQLMPIVAPNAINAIKKNDKKSKKNKIRVLMILLKLEKRLMQKQYRENSLVPLQMRRQRLFYNLWFDKIDSISANGL